jgi:hypothetical protein
VLIRWGDPAVGDEDASKKEVLSMFGDIISQSWLIFAGPDANDSEIEEYVLTEGFKKTERSSITRVTRGVMQTLSKCQMLDNKSYFLWSIHLDLMGTTAATDRILTNVEETMRSMLEQRGAVLSTPFKRVVRREEEGD